MKIYLIGMPGSGKSTIGRMLEKKLNIKNIDLDGLVEKKALMFTDGIIERYGIETFRKIETEALKSLYDKNNIIVSCGGGIVENLENKKYMNGLVIYLDVSNKTIEERLKYDYQRPLLKEKTVEQIYNERFLKYQHFADVNISNNYEIEKTVDNIIKILMEKGYINEENISN